ncbi:MAG TPA: hypothetical protein PLE67_11010 [Tenuifilaceae bacterium]|nr:hypothetical protein [Tenuifilaceae bacterium]HPE19075.1 hypothetical protein [Tenuifilaceae bacterium]
MKHTPFRIKGLFIVSVVTMFLSSCGEPLEGTFNICDEAKIYMVDTTITSFSFVDNFGITESFYMHSRTWYEQHLYYYISGEAYFQHFGVAYSSSLNDFFFMVTMRADDEDTFMEIEWNQRERFGYYFLQNKIEATPKPNMEFIDSLAIQGVTYYGVIKIDYSSVVTQKDPLTPLVTYFAAKYGLIRFDVNENIWLERVSQ